MHSPCDIEASLSFSRPAISGISGLVRCGTFLDRGDADRQPIIDHSEVYSGVYGRASINFYAFNSNGNKGIACSLNNLQLIRAGEPLGGKASAESDFATDAEDDFLN